MENELIFVGGIETDTHSKWIKDQKEYSRNFSQGYRVYDSEGISCTLSINTGGIGGCTGLYIVRELDNG